MKASDRFPVATLTAIATLKAKVCRLFGIRTKTSLSDGSAASHQGSHEVRADWFQQIHGNSDTVVTNQKGLR